jgi:hypothetical protein
MLILYVRHKLYWTRQLGSDKRNLCGCTIFFFGSKIFGWYETNNLL